MVAVEWKLVGLIFLICCSKIVYSWWQSAATDGECEQNNLTQHIFSYLHACLTVSHVIFAQNGCPRHVIHVSCACVSDLSSTLNFALFTFSLIFYFILLIFIFTFNVGRFGAKPPVRFANEESDSLVNNVPLTASEERVFLDWKAGEHTENSSKEIALIRRVIIGILSYAWSTSLNRETHMVTVVISDTRRLMGSPEPSQRKRSEYWLVALTEGVYTIGLCVPR